jgi:hypothetical protein
MRLQQLRQRWRQQRPGELWCLISLRSSCTTGHSNNEPIGRAMVDPYLQWNIQEYGSRHNGAGDDQTTQQEGMFKFPPAVTRLISQVHGICDANAGDQLPRVPRPPRKRRRQGMPAIPHGLPHARAPQFYCLTLLQHPIKRPAYNSTKAKKAYGFNSSLRARFCQSFQMRLTIFSKLLMIN